MSGSFSVKLKSKKGQFILSDLSDDLKIAELKTRISAVTEIKELHMHILMGFPSRPIDLSENNVSIKSKGIKCGETLIIEEKIPPSENGIHRSHSSSISGPSRSGNSSSIETITAAQASLEADEALARLLQAQEESGVRTPRYMENLQNADNDDDYTGILLKKEVPADNSCLFTSIRFVLNGRMEEEGSEMMRHLIAQEVLFNPTVYNDAILDKSNLEYSAWIQRPDSWGGAIEIAILSNYYGIEIDVVDVQNAIINRFGEDKCYGMRVFLFFDGIHYDPLYMEKVGRRAKTIFPVEEISVYQQAEQLAIEARASRQYTNVDKFTLRCMECDMLLVGQVQAQEHAKATGHKNFGEIQG